MGNSQSQFNGSTPLPPESPQQRYRHGYNKELEERNCRPHVLAKLSDHEQALYQNHLYNARESNWTNNNDPACEMAHIHKHWERISSLPDHNIPSPVRNVIDKLIYRYNGCRGSQ